MNDVENNTLVIKNNNTRLIENYDNFLEQLKIIFPDTVDNLNYFVNEDDNTKYNRCLTFVNSFNDENFDMFLKSKLKVFSHKSPDTLAISSSLFTVNDECKFYLKELLNNQPDQVKNIIWNNLYTIYLLTEVSKQSPNNTRVKLLGDLLISNEPNERIKLMKDRINDVIGDNVNDATKEMLNDIIECFNNVIDSPNKMLPEMMAIIGNITTKYSEKLNSGEIEIEKVVRLTLNRFPGVNPGMIEQVIGLMNMKLNKQNKPIDRVIMDENFSTANVEVGNLEENANEFKLRSLLPLLSSLNKFKKDGSMPTPEFLMSTLKGAMGNVEGTDELMNFANNMMETGQMDGVMSSLSGFMSQMNDTDEMDNIMSLASKIMTQVEETGNLPDMNTVFESTEMNSVLNMIKEKGIMDNDNILNLLGKNNNKSDCEVDMEELLNLTKQ